MRKLKDIDFFRKISNDLTEGTVAGGGLSLGASVFMLILFILEFNNYLSVSYVSEIQIDERMEDKMDINFNITLMGLPCQYSSVDVSDVLGFHSVNVTTNIRKFSVGAEVSGGEVRRLEEVPEVMPEIKHQEVPGGHEGHSEQEQITTQLVGDEFDAFILQNEMTLVNFYAPWCIWSQRLGHTWEHTAGVLKTKPYGGEHGVRLAKVDCTDEKNHNVCHKNHVNAFPTVMTFRDGKTHSHDHYHGDRTTDAFITYIEGIRTQAGLSNTAPVAPPSDAVAMARRLNAENAPPAPSRRGCMIYGFVTVKKVPGTLYFSAQSSTHSFAQEFIDMSHRMDFLSYTNTQEPPEDVPAAPDSFFSTVSSRMDGREYNSIGPAVNVTHEHYVKLVSTEFHALSGAMLHNYKYTVNSHQLTSTDVMPSVKFTHDLSPMSVVYREARTPFFKFLTSACAIIGGVFTVIGLMDSVAYHGYNALKKKVELGKQG